MATTSDDVGAQPQSQPAESLDLPWPEEDGTPDDEVNPTHNASGLMPAQDEAILEDVDPDQIPTTDAWGRQEA